MLHLVSALLTLTAGPATPPPNTIVPPMFYSEIVNTAQQIVAGTVTGSKCRYERGKETIVTLVTFSGLTVYKGKVGKTITIRLEGGKMGDDNLRVPLMPKFKIGAKYLVYVDGLGGKKVSPIVGFHQGAFQVVIKNGKEVLLNTGGEELIGIQKDRFVFAAKPEPKIPNAAPKAVVATLDSKPALPNVSQIEEAQARKAKAEGEATQKTLPIAGYGDANVKGPDSEGRQVANPKRKRKDALPIVVLPQHDTGARLTSRSLLSLSQIEGR